MDLSTEIATSNPLVAIILGCIGVAGTLASALLHTAVKRGLAQSEENAQLKQESILSDVDKIRSELLLKLERMSGDFRVLEAQIKSALMTSDKALSEQARRTDAALNAVKNVIQRGESRFDVLQKELAAVRIYCDRIKKEGA